jgi:hypothetical protein
MRLKHACLAWLCAMSLPAAVAAQTPAQPPAPMQMPAGDVALSGTFVRDSVPSDLFGWSLSASRHTTPHLSAVGELSRHAGDQRKPNFPGNVIFVTPLNHYVETAGAFGVRFSAEPGSRSLPFAQVLIGLNHRQTTTSSMATPISKNCLSVDTIFAVDIRVNGPLAARVGAGWRYLLTDDRYHNELRAIAGLTILIGR